MPLRTIKGTTVLVTGATSGIGRETARAFSRAGAQVILAGRRKERLREIVEEIEQNGGEAFAVPTDVSDPVQVTTLIEQAVSRFGKVDTLINNAGVGMAASFAEQSIEDFRQVMEVNFWGTVYTCQEVVPLMQAQATGGVIINISSILGKRGVPFSTAYCASKFALAGFSESLRTEVKSKGIEVSTIFSWRCGNRIFFIVGKSDWSRSNELCTKILCYRSCSGHCSGCACSPTRNCVIA